MSDILKNRKDAKFIKDLEKKLNDKGYELVSYTPARVKGSHGTVTVKNPETQQVVESNYSSKTSPRAVKNLVTQIVKLFSGRGRRGQGEFKLSSDGPQREEWFGVLKAKRMSERSKEVIAIVMMDGKERSIRQILEDASTYVGENPTKHSMKDIPTNQEVAGYFRNNPDYEKVGKYPTMYRRVWNGRNNIFSFPIRE